MLKELDAASGLLCAALERYLDACSAIENYSVSRVFSDPIANELLRIGSYETKIHQARIAMRRAKNYSSGLITINTLPSEILLQIFCLVSDADTKDCCSDEQRTLDDAQFPKYPDLLSHVCSRWRHIAIKHRAIWAHLDLVPYDHPYGIGLFDRAEVYAARAEGFPLTVHIIEPFDDMEGFDFMTELVPFLARIAPQLRTLTCYAYDLSSKFYRSLLQACFENSVPGALTQLNMTEEGAMVSACGLIEATDNHCNAGSVVLDLPQQHLDDIWRSVTVLRLGRIFPYWTSAVYHGLVELRLMSWSTRSTHPTKLQVMNILKCSPGLRVLYFELPLATWLRAAGGSALGLAKLDHLEVLHLKMELKEAESSLSLVHPGSKPLQMTLVIPFTHIPPGNTGPPLQSVGCEIARFFARSHVTKLRTSGLRLYPSASSLLSLAPDLDILVLSLTNGGRPARSLLLPGEHDLPNIRRRLGALIIASSTLDLHELQQLLANHSIQTLTCWWCDFTLDGRPVSNKLVRGHMTDICTKVELLGVNDRYPNPLSDWE